MCLKKLLVILLLLSAVLSLYSESLQDASEAELLTELTMILTELENDNQKLTESLTTVSNELTGLRANYRKLTKLSTTQQEELNELKTSLQNYAAEKQKEIILTAAVSGAVGIAIGAVTVLILH